MRIGFSKIFRPTQYPIIAQKSQTHDFRANRVERSSQRSSEPPAASITSELFSKKMRTLPCRNNRRYKRYCRSTWTFLHVSRAKNTPGRHDAPRPSVFCTNRGSTEEMLVRSIVPLAVFVRGYIFNKTNIYKGSYRFDFQSLRVFPHSRVANFDTET